jgi:hypothetical protein
VAVLDALPAATWLGREIRAVSEDIGSRPEVQSKVTEKTTPLTARRRAIFDVVRDRRPNRLIRSRPVRSRF